MHLRAFLLISFLAGFIPAVLACEGECIVQITQAFIGNYSKPIGRVIRELSEQISMNLLPPTAQPNDPTIFMQPILRAYNKISYDLLETAIFPSYFHGKCQRFSKDGQDPPGCPNPDCPVVCGTPGSLVHFYPTLRYIAYNSTKNNLEGLTTPGNPAYDQVNALVEKAKAVNKRDVPVVATHGMGTNIDPHTPFERRSGLHSRHFGPRERHDDLSLRKRTSTLASIFAQSVSMLNEACGGNARDSEDALPKCSWEKEMKAFILSFP